MRLLVAAAAVMALEDALCKGADCLRVGLISVPCGGLFRDFSTRTTEGMLQLRSLVEPGRKCELIS